MTYVAVNMENSSAWQAQTDSLLRTNGIRVCGNDYVGAAAKFAVRNLFAPPNATNSDPRPVFVAINGLSNSPSHRQWQVLVSDFSNGGGAANYSAAITRWRAQLDAVQAPPPQLTNIYSPASGVGISFPGQRGRTNVVEFSTDMTTPMLWTPLTNFFGTNLPSVFREPDFTNNELRVYRVRRL